MRALAAGGPIVHQVIRLRKRAPTGGADSLATTSAQAGPEP
jgi:hypothetical protein